LALNAEILGIDPWVQVFNLVTAWYWNKFSTGSGISSTN